MADAMGENISSDNITGIEVKLTRAQKYGSAPVEGSTSAMTRTEAREYIERLSLAEKIRLNELLKALEQKRQPSPSLRELIGKGGL